jgi:hypothetical protein
MRQWIVLKAIMAFFLIGLCPIMDQPQHFRQIRGASSFWQVVEDQSNRWWFRSPTGELKFINAVTTIQPRQTALLKLDTSFVSRDFDGTHLDDWAQRTTKRVLDTGFNASGAWSNPAIAKYLPYAKDLNLSKCCDVSINNPAWSTEVETAVRLQVVPLQNDKNLIGYYLDNELLWDSDPLLEANATKYFDTTTKYVREYDPNHLILGVRFNRRAPLDVIEAMRGKVDVQSVNVYSGTGTLWVNNIRELYDITNAPVVVSEFSFWSDNNDSKDRNKKAWWDGVASQTRRAEMYKTFVLGVATNSFMIGCDWFQWNDEPAFGRAPDGEDLNCGIVNVNDKPYPEMVSAVQYVAARTELVHASSNDLQEGSIWVKDQKRYATNQEALSQPLSHR